ncbi:hypothetical protein LWE13_000798 [Escherichia coli]|nr:hypothetical protein [Escherichia coli]
MQGQPKTKHQELVETLSLYINSRTPLEEPLLGELLREINKQSVASRAYLMALWMEAQNRHDETVAWYLEAIATSGEHASVVAGNYLSYLSCSAHNLFHRTELFRLVDIYCTKRIRRMARNAAFCMGNDRLVNRFTVMMKALLDGQEREEIEREGAKMVEAIVTFKEATKLTSSEIQKLCDSAEQIANSQGVNCAGVEYFLSGGYDNAIILFADTSDSSTLTTMNMELIGLLADDPYIDRPFTSWFKSSDMKDRV